MNHVRELPVIAAEYACIGECQHRTNEKLRIYNNSSPLKVTIINFAGTFFCDFGLIKHVLRVLAICTLKWYRVDKF